MQVSASTQGGAPRPSSAYHACRSRLCRPYALRCRAGVHARREVCIGLTLWFCVSAAPQGRGGLRQPGRVLARSCAAPLSRLTPTAPLAGEPFRRLPKVSPARGGGCAGRRRRGALPVGGGGIRQGPAGACPVSVGDDAGIVPQTLRRRQALRRAKSPALQSTRKRAVMRKRQLSARSAGGPMQASAPTQGAGGVRRTGRVLAG